MELGNQPSFRVLLLGGFVNTGYAFTYGADVLNQLRQFRADKTILSIDGIHVDAGITTYHAEEALVNLTMMERSAETIVVADSSKLGQESFSFVSGISQVSCLVTNPTSNETITGLEESGIKIVLSEK